MNKCQCWEFKKHSGDVSVHEFTDSLKTLKVFACDSCAKQVREELAHPLGSCVGEPDRCCCGSCTCGDTAKCYLSYDKYDNDFKLNYYCDDCLPTYKDELL